MPKKDDVVTDHVAVPRAKQTGVALELDAIKKIGHQLSRLTTYDSRQRAIAFVQSYVGGKSDTQPGPAEEKDKDGFGF